MQRLTRLLRSPDRGASAVVIGILMVSLLGSTAIAVDVGSLWADKRELQNGADAAALAIAQDCAKGACDATKATAYAIANKNDRNATVSSVSFVPTGTVTVTTSSLREHWFAPILGVDSTTVTAKASASWGWPSGGTTIPLAFSYCDVQAQTHGGLPTGTTPVKISFSKTSGTSCTGPSGNVVPGGFGWLDVTGGTCTVATSIDQTVGNSTGASGPGSCTNFSAFQDKTVLIPVFDSATGTGNNAEYHMWGYAAFKLTGYNFVQYQWNCAKYKCGGNDRWIEGYFTTYVTLEDAVTSTTAPHLGAAIVKLTA